MATDGMFNVWCLFQACMQGAELRNVCCHLSMTVTVRVMPWQSVFLLACMLGHSSSEQGGSACRTHICVVWCRMVMLFT